MNLKTLKIFRFFIGFGIGMSLYALFTSFASPLSPMVGGILTLEIWMVVKIQKRINHIQDCKQLVKILTKLLEKMKDQNATNIKDLK